MFIIKRVLLLSLLFMLFTPVSHAGVSSLFNKCKDALENLLSEPTTVFDSPLSALAKENQLSQIRGGLEVNETLRIEKGTNSKVNEIIEKLIVHKGELRIVEAFRGIKKVKGRQGFAYFRVDEVTGYPIISIERKSSFDTLIHEYTHFLDWEKLKIKFLKEVYLKETEASLKASKVLLSPKMRWMTEINAVRAEMIINGETLDSKKYIQRLVYPELVTVQNIFDLKDISKKQERLQKRLMRFAIEKSFVAYAAQLNIKNMSIEEMKKNITPRKLMLSMGILNYRYELEYLYNSIAYSLFKSNQLQYLPHLGQNNYKTFRHLQ